MKAPLLASSIISGTVEAISDFDAFYLTHVYLPIPPLQL